jgi:hypothetical protein
MTDRREEIITAVFRKCATFAQTTGNGQWKLAVANGKTIPVSAELLGDWLILDAPCEGPREAIDYWRLLALNGGLSGPGKLALLQDNLRLRAEVFLADEESLASRPAEACAGIVETMAAIEWPTEGARSAGWPAMAARQTATEVRLSDLCKEAGWDFVERVEGVLAVPLETRVGFHQAFIEPSDTGARANVEIARAANLTETSRRAIGALLLRTAGRLRLARAAVEECGEQAVIRFEARPGPQSRAADLRHALAALSLACDICAREVAELEDERVAAGYLAIARV